jgi:hypothetical protein
VRFKGTGALYFYSFRLCSWRQQAVGQASTLSRNSL